MRSIVRKSCEAFMACHPDCIASIHEDQIDTFLDSIDQAFYQRVLQKEKAQMTMPLKFQSDHQKLNFFSIMHLLNFGSGYRVILKAANGMGAFDNIIRLLIAAHLTGADLTSAWMRAITPSQVGELMNIDMTIDVPVPSNPILHEVKPSPASVIVAKIAHALKSTGNQLEQLGGYKYLIDFVEASVQKSSNVDALLNHLAQLAVLNDIFTASDGTVVYLYKKMQVMISELRRNGLSVPCVGPGDLTIFSDNCIPTMLRHYKLISCPSAEDALANDRNLEPAQAASLRAASVVICEKIVKRANGMAWLGDEIDLDNYLWKVAKEGELRQLPRYAERDTWFY